MDNAASMGTTYTNQRSQLAATIERFRSEFSCIRSELQLARTENSQLRREIAFLRTQCKTIPNTDISSLRRGVAYYCHPDRGGDASLMAKLNTLFDMISSIQTTNSNANQCDSQGVH